MKKITDKDVEALKAGKKVTKGFIHMQLDDKGILNMWTDNNITDKYRDEYEKKDDRRSNRFKRYIYLTHQWQVIY